VSPHPATCPELPVNDLAGSIRIGTSFHGICSGVKAGSGSWHVPVLPTVSTRLSTGPDVYDFPARAGDAEDPGHSGPSEQRRRGDRDQPCARVTPAALALPEAPCRGGSLSGEVWPEYNQHGETLNHYWAQLYDVFGEWQFVLGS
jgi:hypothetical protein